jgi:hypothetical protein
MYSFCGLATISFALSAGALYAEDLAKYRDFRLESNLVAVTKQLGASGSDVKLVHERPALIQELRWQRPYAPPTSAGVDSVKEIHFSFYNGILHRLVVIYDRDRTEGLTTADIVNTLSATYGQASRSAAELVFPSMYNETVRVLARWEDEQTSVNLVSSAYNPTYGLIIFSRRADALAQAAMTRAGVLDNEQAPVRERERQLKEAEAVRVGLEKARLVNKGSFRP